MSDSPKRFGATVVAVCVGSGLAHLPTSTMPFQIGALVEGGGLTASAAGVFGFCQVGTLALTMILVAPWLDRMIPAWVALAGGVAAAIANSALFPTQLLVLQLLCGAVAGAGYGLVFAATVAAAAATPQPDRMYAVGNGVALLMIVALMSALPSAAAHLGPTGIFAALGGVSVLSLPLFLGFGRGQRTHELRLAAWRVPGAPGLLFAWTTFSLGTGGLYAFSERVGRSIPLEPTQVALVLSSGVFIGLIGTGAAAVLGGNVNRRVALMIGMCGSAVACLVLGLSWSFVSFAVGVALYWVFYMFLYSYLFGTAAILDPRGRVGTLGGGLERLGYGIGSALGGILAQHAGYAATGYLGCAGCVLGMAGFSSLFRSLAPSSRAELDSSA